MPKLPNMSKFYSEILWPYSSLQQKWSISKAIMRVKRQRMISKDMLLKKTLI